MAIVSVYNIASLPVRLVMFRVNEAREETKTKTGFVLASFVNSVKEVTGIVAAGALGYAAGNVAGLGAFSWATAALAVYANAWRMGNNTPDFCAVRPLNKPRPVFSGRVTTELTAD